MALRDAWLHAPVGRLSAWQQARALALREVSRELHAGRARKVENAVYEDRVPATKRLRQ